MNILVLTPDYPDDRRPTFSFVKQLVDEMAKKGHTIQVVAPYSLTHNLRLIPQKEVVKIGKGKVIIYRPYYISLSNMKLGRFYPSSWFHNHAYQRGLRKVEIEPDLVYGHFWTSAYQGYHYAKKNHKPLFIATGESAITFVCDSRDKRSFCDFVTGVICVSTKNQDESLRHLLTTKEKCIVIPNAIDSCLFKKMDKEECRIKLGLPLEVFIVAFVGWFSERKGSGRLSNAIAMIDEKEPVFSIFIGEGSMEPTCKNILFKGRLPHEMIPTYLSAADVFVLPTLNEGCCNAIIEAMACGLPIISSNLPFNWDILNEKNSIMVDPNSVEQISEAIRKLKNNRFLREEMSQSALETVKSLSIDKRALRIMDFIEKQIKYSK